jgi:glyoxylase-like metal-dependent hydrolase (beta-lactamase superfamily II)
MPDVISLDLLFQNQKSAIAAYLIPYSGGAVLVESGPGSTIDAVKMGLAAHDLAPKDITHVLVTHIHLDHAGAAGWFSGQGAQVFVHPVGAPHLLNPEKLIASATRTYGDRMETLWGQFWPVPAANLTEVQDGAEIIAGELCFRALHTPGHAEHHVSYILDDICFTGDVGGVRLPGPLYLRMPFIPPELHIEKWRDSLEKLRKFGCKRVAPTHFGIYDDAAAHLTLARRILDETERWLEAEMSTDLPIEILRERFSTWQHQQGLASGIAEDILEIYEIINPTWMGADGFQRYWRKVRMAA